MTSLTMIYIHTQQPLHSNNNNNSKPRNKHIPHPRPRLGAIIVA